MTLFVNSFIEKKKLIQSESFFIHSASHNSDTIQVSGVFDAEESHTKEPNSTNVTEAQEACQINDEWFSDELSSDESDVIEIEELFDDMKIGVDHHLAHSKLTTEEENEMPADNESDEEETETVNKTNPHITAGEKTLLDCFSMSWAPTEDNAITLGYGKKNKVSLPPEYYKEFTRDKNIIQDLSLVGDEKFICSLTQIENLIEVIQCEICGSMRHLQKHGFIGSVGELWLVCEKGHLVKWTSSEKVNGIYATNLQLLSSIILSGNLYVKFSLLAKFLNLQIPSEVSFYRIAKHYVNPSVDLWWKEMQSLMFDLFRNKEVVIGGDGRNDSPGHCATYCTYSFIDSVSNLILHQEIVDVREAELKSPNMEKLGCKRGLDKLREHLTVKGLVTDDHNQISAMMSKNFYLILKFTF